MCLHEGLLSSDWGMLDYPLPHFLGLLDMSCSDCVEGGGDLACCCRVLMA